MLKAILIPWLLAVCPQEPPEAKGESREFDLGDLRIVGDRPAPDLVGSDVLRLKEDSSITPLQVADFVMDTLYAAGYEGFDAAVRGQMFRVEGSRECLDFAEGMIEAMRSRLADKIRLRARFVQVSVAEWLSEGDPVSLLSKGEILSDLTISVLPGRRASAASRQEVTYVKNFRTDVGGPGAVVSTAVTDQIMHGAAVDVRAGTVPTSDKILVELRGEVVLLDTPMESVDAGAGRKIETPVTHPVRLRSALLIRPGETVVAGAVRHEKGIVGLLLTANRDRDTRVYKLPPHPEKGYAHRLFNASALVHRLTDFSAQSLGAAYGGGGVTFELEETKDDFIEFLLNSLSPESWSVGKASLRVFGPWLYAANRVNVLTRLDGALRSASEQRLKQLTTRAWLVSMTREEVKDWDRRPEVSAEQAEQWLRQGDLLGGGEILSVHGQQVFIQGGSHHVYLERYEPLVDDGGVGDEAKLNLWRDGTVLEMRGTILKSGEVRLDGTLAWGDLLRMRQKPVTKEGGFVQLPHAREESFELSFPRMGAGWKAVGRGVGDEILILLLRSERK